MGFHHQVVTEKHCEIVIRKASSNFAISYCSQFWTDEYCDMDIKIFSKANSTVDCIHFKLKVSCLMCIHKQL